MNYLPTLTTKRREILSFLGISEEAYMKLDESTRMTPRGGHLVLKGFGHKTGGQYRISCGNSAPGKGKVMPINRLVAFMTYPGVWEGYLKGSKYRVGQKCKVTGCYHAEHLKVEQLKLTKPAVRPQPATSCSKIIEYGTNKGMPKSVTGNVKLSTKQVNAIRKIKALHPDVPNDLILDLLDDEVKMPNLVNIINFKTWTWLRSVEQIAKDEHKKKISEVKALSASDCTRNGKTVNPITHVKEDLMTVGLEQRDAVKEELESMEDEEMDPELENAKLGLVQKFTKDGYPYYGHPE